MSNGKRWPYMQAMEAAARLLGELRPYTERIEIAGSLRRKRDDVGDIELVCVPKVSEDMFGGRGQDLLHQHIDGLVAAGTLAKRPNVNGGFTYGEKNKLLVDRASGIPLDVFTTEARYWGMALFVRTGPADWNKRAMAHFLSRGMAGHAYRGVTLANGEDVDCPEEADVFRHLGWPWAEPEVRA